MTDNTQRFTGRVEAYERYRQRYPAEQILAMLREWCHLTPADVVADIGAGTGMLADVFLSNGNHVLAVEPNAEMRAALNPQPNLEIIDATAEATTLPSASVDMVAAGRAFHWFNRELALPEFRRILKPGGWVVLVSLGRAHDDSAQTRALEQIFAQHSADFSRIREGYRVHERLREFFPGELHETEITGSMKLDWQGLLGMMLSLSISPQPDDPLYPGFESALRTFFKQYAEGETITVPTSCKLSAGRL